MVSSRFREFCWVFPGKPLPRPGVGAASPGQEASGQAPRDANAGGAAIDGDDVSDAPDLDF